MKHDKELEKAQEADIRSGAGSDRGTAHAAYIPAPRVHDYGSRAFGVPDDFASARGLRSGANRLADGGRRSSSGVSAAGYSGGKDENDRTGNPQGSHRRSLAGSDAARPARRVHALRFEGNNDAACADDFSHDGINTRQYEGKTGAALGGASAYANREAIVQMILSGETR